MKKKDIDIVESVLGSSSDLICDLANFGMNKGGEYFLGEAIKKYVIHPLRDQSFNKFSIKLQEELTLDSQTEELESLIGRLGNSKDIQNFLYERAREATLAKGKEWGPILNAVLTAKILSEERSRNVSIFEKAMYEVFSELNDEEILKAYSFINSFSLAFKSYCRQNGREEFDGNKFNFSTQKVVVENEEIFLDNYNVILYGPMPEDGEEDSPLFNEVWILVSQSDLYHKGGINNSSNTTDLQSRLGGWARKFEEFGIWNKTVRLEAGETRGEDKVDLLIYFRDCDLLYMQDVMNKSFPKFK